MNKLSVFANAKINLTLDITGVRADGYHLLRSIMHRIALCDTVTVCAEPSDSVEITVASDKSYIPCDRKNTMFKAAEAFCDAWGKGARIEISAKKNIPVGAGMGGGSADAAAVLIALNQLLNAGFSEEELCGIGLKVGADVPFCIVGGTAVVTGVGEELCPIPTLPEYPLVICKPRGGASTPVIYGEYDRMGKNVKGPDNEAAEAAAKAGDVPGLCRYCKNVLTEAASVYRPEIPVIKKALAGCGAMVSEMTGSGSAVFGIFDTKEKAEAAADKLRRSFDTVILTSL